MTPLIRKLGIREGARIYVQDAPAAVLAEMNTVQALEYVGAGEEADYIHLFVKDLDNLLSQLDESVRAVSTNGMMWVSWPKKASGVSTNLDRDTIREILLETGLVDVKVCAVDDIWSGLKFVRRKKDRK